MTKDKEADRENPATPSDPAIERRRARGQTEAHKQMREWDEGGYQTTDPTSGQERGPLAPHAQPENQLGPVGPEEGSVPQVDDDDVDMQPGRAVRSARSSSDAATDYDGMTVEELRSEAGDLEVRRGDGVEGAPLKADYVKALRKRDRAK